jgi:phage FluMu protein Com
MLIAKNPFDETEEIIGCPKCKDVNTIVSVCDEKGCWKRVTCGTPIKDGYRSTCGKHAP